MSRAKKTCPCCGLNNVGPVKSWARVTQYADESQNTLKSCVHCIREDDEYFTERWNDYYGEQGFNYGMQPPHRDGRRKAIKPKPAYEDFNWLFS